MLRVDSQLEAFKYKAINLLCLNASDIIIRPMQQIYYKPHPIMLYVATTSIEKHLFSVFPQQNSVHVVGKRYYLQEVT